MKKLLWNIGRKLVDSTTALIVIKLLQLGWVEYCGQVNHFGI